MAPEMFVYQGVLSYTSAVDIWAAGVMAIQILVGTIPNLQQLQDYGGTSSRYDPFGKIDVSSQARHFTRRLFVQRPEWRPNAKQCSEDPWLQMKTAAPTYPNPNAFGFGKPPAKAESSRKAQAVSAPEYPWLQTKAVAPEHPKPNASGFGKTPIKVNNPRKAQASAPYNAPNVGRVASLSESTPTELSRKAYRDPVPAIQPMSVRPAATLPHTAPVKTSLALAVPLTRSKRMQIDDGPHSTVGSFVIERQQECLLLDKDTSPVRAVAWGNSRWVIASASSDTTVMVWESSTLQVSTLWGHAKAVRAVEFSNDDRLLASASDDRSILIWAAAPSPSPSPVPGWSPWKCHGVLRDHQGPVVSVSFSHDDKYLASASDDHTVVIWDADTMSKARTLNKFDMPVGSAKFSATDRTLVVVLRGGLDVEVWSELRRGGWTMHKKYSWSSPVLYGSTRSIATRGVEPHYWLSTVTSTGWASIDSRDGPCAMGVTSDIPLQAISPGSGSDRLAGPDWVATLQDPSPQQGKQRYPEIGNHGHFDLWKSRMGSRYVQSTRLSAKIRYLPGTHKGANDVKISRFGDTAFALQDGTSIFVVGAFS